MNDKQMKIWGERLAEQRKELGIEAFRPTDPKRQGRIELFSDEPAKCIVCGKETKVLFFISRNNQGQTTNVCKECLKKGIELLNCYER